jgi:hypothetical protein
VSAALDLQTIDELTGGGLGRFDVRCLSCGPERRSPANQRRRVMRVWRLDPSFASFHCARCGESGYARDGSGRQIDRAVIERARAEAAERENASAFERLGKARWLWSKRRPLAGSIAETYLREARGYGGTLPSTLGFLPARGAHGPAMIAAFGVPEEPEPGLIIIADDAVTGVHITRLMPDGSGKSDDQPNKLMLGKSNGWPIVLAAANDLLGLAVTEGVEDGLSVHEATGLGVWVAGSASRLPALAAAIPDYIECATIFAHDDDDGQRHARELAERLAARGGIEIRVEGLDEGTTQ